MSLINYEWAENLPLAVTVCDLSATIIYMNSRSRLTFVPDGGTLLGRSLREFHSPSSWDTIVRLLSTGESNTYTVEKHGVNKLINQSPWFTLDGKVGGLVEISVVLPSDMPHYVR